MKNDPKRKIFEKFDIVISCKVIENNQLKCGDYSILFSIHAHDDEQHSLRRPFQNWEFFCLWSFDPVVFKAGFQSCIFYRLKDDTTQSHSKYYCFTKAH